MPRLIWTAFLLMSLEGFLVYAVGFITPFLRTTLQVEPWLAAMPSSAMAVGMGVGGALARRVNVRFGAQLAIRAWVITMALGGVLLAMPVSVLVTIAGGVVLGASIGGMLVHVNSALGQGPHGGLLLTRANLASMSGSLVGPIVLSVAASSIGWWYGVLAPVPFLLAVAFVMPGSPARDAQVATGAAEPPLSSAFWLSWAFLALCIGAEFSFVVWGSQVVATRTGIASEAATGLAALYVAGMVAGRLVASVAHLGPRLLLLALRLGTAVSALGALVLWIAPRPELAGLGLFLGGLGMSAIYPLGVGLALSHAPLAPVRASARLTLASSSSIFAAPLVLGLVAGATGIVGAWAIVLAILGAAFVLVLRVGVPAAAVDRAEVLPG